MELQQQTQTNQPQEKKSGGEFAVKTLLLILALTIIAGGLLWLALVQLVQIKNQQVSTKSLPTPTPDPIQTILTISSIPIPLATPSAYSTDIIINTGSDKINSVQLELSYDPKVLTKVDIVPGSFFVDPVISIKNIDSVNGRITFVLNASGPKNLDNGVLGQGIIAQVRFSTVKGLKQTQTFINFEPKTQVLGPNFATSLLKSTVNASFSIGSEVIPTKMPTATSAAR